MIALDPSLIRGFELFSALDDDQLRAILEDARPRRVAKGAALFEQGGDAEEFFVLLDGRLKVVQVTSQGEQVLVRFTLPGEVCGIAVAFKRPDYPASAIAVVDSLALAWPSESWDGLCARAPALALNTLRTVGQRLQDAHSLIREISTEQAERRVANALLRLVGQAGKKTADGIVIAFPLTRQDMADMTGLTVYTVSRIMSAWDTQGLVESGRQSILVRNPHRLALIAEGDGQDVGPTDG